MILVGLACISFQATRERRQRKQQDRPTLTALHCWSESDEALAARVASQVLSCVLKGTLLCFVLQEGSSAL